MIVKRGTEIKLRQFGAIILAWQLVGLLITAYDYLALHTQYSQGPNAEYSFLLSLTMNLGSAFMGALLGGSFLVFYVNVKYPDKPYGYTIIAVSLSYILTIAVIIMALGIVFVPIRTGKPFLDPASQAAFRHFLFDTSRIKNTMIWSIVVSVTQLFLQMNAKFGHGVFWNMIRGKYNTPKEENRVFMFLDLNSSTAIAEKLGDEKYHALLREFFADITNPILDNKGEIYQYAGDQVVVAWKYEEGIADNHCVQCFFDMKRNVEEKKEEYMLRYGIVPSFKAGIHRGKVIVGEVGILKRDITYSGDVLNTAARIQSVCKQFDAEVIASSDLLAGLSLARNYVTQPLGAIKLRGKRKEVWLSALAPA